MLSFLRLIFSLYFAFQRCRPSFLVVKWLNQSIRWETICELNNILGIIASHETSNESILITVSHE